jgi:hypothetical protein
MRIILDQDVLNTHSCEEDAVLSSLLVTLAQDTHSHALLTDPVYVPGEHNEMIDAWLARTGVLELTFRDILNRGLIASAGPRSVSASDTDTPRRWNLHGVLEFRVERRAISDWTRRRLTIGDAIDLINEPVHMVLENARTELAFIRALAGPTNGAELRARIEQPGKIFVHGGGGGEAKSWLVALTEGTPTATKWRRMLRTWVLFDQDAGDPDARTPSAAAVTLMEECEKVLAMYGDGLSWVCLRRRELESYVPDSGLRFEQNTRLQQLVDRVTAWRADPVHQTWAWALDLKKGLHGDRHPRWSHGLSEAEIHAIKQGHSPMEPHMLRTPFSSLSPNDIVVLARGFGDALGVALRASKDPHWALDIGKEYDRGPSDQAPRLFFVQSIFDRM